MQRGAHRFGSAVDGAADAAIGIARAHHQRGEIERLARDGRGFHLGDPLGAPPLVVKRGVLRESGRSGRVGKARRLRRIAADGPDEHGLDDAFARQSRRGFEHARDRCPRERRSSF